MSRAALSLQSFAVACGHQGQSRAQTSVHARRRGERGAGWRPVARPGGAGPQLCRATSTPAMRSMRFTVGNSRVARSNVFNHICGCSVAVQTCTRNGVTVKRCNDETAPCNRGGSHAADKTTDTPLKGDIGQAPSRLLHVISNPCPLLVSVRTCQCVGSLNDLKTFGMPIYASPAPLAASSTK